MLAGSTTGTAENVLVGNGVGLAETGVRLAAGCVGIAVAVGVAGGFVGVSDGLAVGVAVAGGSVAVDVGGGGVAVMTGVLAFVGDKVEVGDAVVGVGPELLAPLRIKRRSSRAWSLEVE